VHPPDWLQSHPVVAKSQETDCAACHRSQEFCVACHQQVGAAKESRLRQPGTPLAATRFHPPGFADLVRTSPNHHSFAAQANMQSCVSCHEESTCLACHSTQGVTAHVSPHPMGFKETGAACRALSSAPIACAKCHGGGAGLANLRTRLVGCN
jgi:hypothetical protein